MLRDFPDWRQKERPPLPENVVQTTKEELATIAHRYFLAELTGPLETFDTFRDKSLVETVQTSRYSIEVGYRTTSKDALEGFARIALGYVSAAIKNYGWHTKHVFSEKPLRLLVTNRNWDDGSWVGLITWHPDEACFVLSRGFYNKARKSVSLQHSRKCTGESAADMVRELHSMMHHLQDKPDNHLEKMKPVPLKRGPKG